MKKLLFIVLDGAADTPNPEIGNKTAFEVANTPNIDFIARNGKNGLMQVMPIAPESDEAVLSLLGYDVFKVYTGRGPLEALGGGVPFKDGNIAFRCNFATVEDNAITNVRADLISEIEARELESAINQYVTLTNAEFLFKSTAGYRCVLVIKSKEKLSPKISNTHPGYELRLFETVWNRNGAIQYVPISEALKKPVMNLKESVPLEITKAASTSARIVNEFLKKSKLVLENHVVNKRRLAEGKAPANVILVRDAGDKLPKLYSLKELYGLRWACFAEVPVERGIGQLAGMDIIPLPLPTENTEQDMTIRILTLLKNLQLYDAFYIHLKGPDSFAHIGDIKGKIDSIEKIDRFFIRQLLKNVDLQNTIIVVTCDHTTSSHLKAHTENPVPITVFGVGMPDNLAHFSEKECFKGSLGHINTRQLMDYLMKLVK